MGFKKKLKINKETKDILNNTSDIKANIKKYLRKFKSFVIDFKTNTVDFLSWLGDKCKDILSNAKTEKEKEKLKKEKLKKEKLNKEKVVKEKKKKNKRIKVINKKLNIALLVTSFGLLLIAISTFMFNIFANRKEAAIVENVDDEIKFIGIKDGYITERLIVESGELLPNILVKDIN